MKLIFYFIVQKLPTEKNLLVAKSPSLYNHNPLPLAETCLLNGWKGHKASGKISCKRMEPEVYQVTGTFFLIRIKCLSVFMQSHLEWKETGKSAGKWKMKKGRLTIIL